MGRVVLGLGLVVGPVVAVESYLPAGFLALSLADAAVALAGYLVFVRWVERRRVREMDPRRLGELALGLALGGGLFAVVIGSIWAAGGVAFDGWDWSADLRYAAGMAVMAGVVEELAARGVVLRLLERAWGPWGALAVSAGLFGGLHLLNPGASLLTAAAIALEAGVLLGAAFLLTRRLWLPIGLHMGWNFVQAGIFGVAVSGNAMGGLISSRPVGPEWISGGAFGAEASVLAVVWCGALGGAMLVLAVRRGRVAG
jgi:uncharacterized protein